MQKLFFVLGLLIMGCFQLPAQSHLARFYTTADGLASSDLTALHVDQHGHVWTTSKGAGISRFDGLRFRNFDNQDQLGTLYFHSIWEEGESLWFGGENTIVHYYLDQWQHFQVRGDVHDINRLDDSTLLLCTSSGIQLFHPQTSGKPPTYLTGDSAYCSFWWGDALWVGTSRGVNVYEYGRWSMLDSTLVAGPSSQFCEDAHGQLWFSSGVRGLCQWNHGKFRPVSQDLPKLASTAIVNGAMSSIISGSSDQGLWVWQNLASLWQPMPDLMTISTGVTGLAYDPWDHLWISTQGQGLVRYAPQSFSYHHRGSGLSGDWTGRIQVVQDSLLIFHQNGKVDVIADGQVRPWNKPNMPDWKLLSYLQTRDGAEWYGTEAGLFRITDSASSEVITKDAQSLYARDLLEVDSTTLLTVGSGGLFLISRENETASWPSQLVHKGEFKVLLHQDSLIWSYGREWLACATVTNPTQWRRVDLKGFSLTCISGLQDRFLLLGTANQGFFVLDLHSDTSSIFPLKIFPEPGHYDRIKSMVTRGRELFFTTRNQLVRVVLDASLNAVEVNTYGQDQGLPPLEFMEGQALTIGDYLFFACRQGVLEMHPRFFQSRGSKPKAFIDYVIFGKKKKSLSEIPSDYTIPHRQNELQIAVGAVDLKSPGGISLQWRMDGWSEPNHWNHLENNEGVYLVSLPGGNYTFEVRALNGSGGYSDIQDFSFRVQKPYYFQVWFVLLASLLTFSLLYAFYRYRMRRALVENQQKQWQLEQRNRMLNLEQSARQLQMNPHFIFNALNSIQAKVALGNQEEARSDIQSFARLMRSVLKQSRQDWISLDEEIESLRIYLQIEQSLKDHRFSYKLDWSEDLEPTLYRVPPMLVQPFVENALQHGLPKNNTTGEIEISFSWKGRYLICQVLDNGPGYTGQGENGAGIQITRDRLQAYFQDREIDPLSFQLRQDENGLTGTRVSIILPLH